MNTEERTRFLRGTGAARRASDPFRPLKGVRGQGCEKVKNTSTSPVCPSCGGELILRRIDDLNVVEYRARCRGCPWVGVLRDLWCGGCHGHQLFKWTDGAWCCTRCGHVRGGQSPPRDLTGMGPKNPEA